MKKLIVARHGKYGPGPYLNSAGKKQMKLLAESIRPSLSSKKDKIVVLTSSAERVKGSAKLISNLLDISTQEHKILQSGGPHDEDFPRYFAKEKLGISLYSHVIEKGKAWLINWTNNTINLLP